MPTRITLSEKASISVSVWDASQLSCLIERAEGHHDYDKVLLRSGRLTASASELFDCNIEPYSVDLLSIHTRQLKLNGLGQGLLQGRIELFGDAGDLVAADMVCGSVVVHGNTGGDVGVGMRGGIVIVDGDAGDRVGGVSPNSGRGMRGGDILVAGSVGHYLGQRMRRGVICVGQNAGDFGVHRMIAGTVVVLGNIGRAWGHGMKRGSVILTRPTKESWNAQLSDAYEFELSFLPLLWKHLSSMEEIHRIRIPQTRWAKRQVGDLAMLGKGEVLTLTRVEMKNSTNETESLEKS